jgi:NADH-quinone oxidoreductase subunit G
MPRQHEGVNEIWICDKGRLGYRYADRSAERLLQPLVRHGGELTPASWEEALDLVAEKFRQAGKELLTVAGGRLSNEDLFYLGEFTARVGGQKALYTHMAGGELTMQAGLAPGSNLADLARGDVVLVVASDLEEEAPVWWLRLKQAADRGVQIIVLNLRPPGWNAMLPDAALSFGQAAAPCRRCSTPFSEAPGFAWGGRRCRQSAKPGTQPRMEISRRGF